MVLVSLGFGFYAVNVSCYDAVGIIAWDGCKFIKHQKDNTGFGVSDVDLSNLTYKDFGISSSEPTYFIEIHSDRQLQRVLERCEYEQKKASGEMPSFASDGKLLLSTQPLVIWNNSTHYNDNNICYFQPLKEYLEHSLVGVILEYCNSDKGPGWDKPFHVWFANETRYIDTDTCLWQKLDGDIALVFPTDWHNVYQDIFEKKLGGPGNRHPAFWGFDIPKVCTEDMIKHLAKYSTMFDRNVPYSLEWIGMGDNINADDFDTCVKELLERNPRELENENIFHGKPLSYWENLDEDLLVDYYEDFGKLDEYFFENLGALLIKSHSEEKLLELGIAHDSNMEIDWSGIRPSLPPRMGFDYKVNSTDGKNYLISGTIHGNVILDNFRIVEDNGRRIDWTPAFDYSRVQINGTAALQICSIMKIDCIKNPVWDAIHRHDKDFTYFYYDTYGVEPNVQIGEHYIQIDKDQICHSFEDLLSRQISELECQEISK